MSSTTSSTMSSTSNTVSSIASSTSSVVSSTLSSMSHTVSSIVSSIRSSKKQPLGGDSIISQPRTWKCRGYVRLSKYAEVVLRLANPRLGIRVLPLAKP
jgi:hypothetical protein